MREISCLGSRKDYEKSTVLSAGQAVRREHILQKDKQFPLGDSAKYRYVYCNTCKCYHLIDIDDISD